MRLRLTKVTLVAITCVAALIAFTAVLWLAVLSPRLAEAGALETEAADLQLTQLSLERKKRDLLDLAEALPAAASQAQQVFAQMPQSAQQPKLLRQLTAAATDANIKAADIAVINIGVPQGIEDVGGDSGVALATMTVDMTVEGTREEVGDFLGNLQGLERSLLITAVTMDAAGDKDEDRWTMSVSATLFVLQSALPDLVAAAEAVAAGAEPQAEKG